MCAGVCSASRACSPSGFGKDSVAHLLPDPVGDIAVLPRQANHGHPNNASYLETLGWIEYQMGDFKLAKSWMEKALAKAPDNARMNERMGDIQFRLGNPDDALRYWKKAKEKGGTNPALDRKISTKTMLDTE